MRILISGNFMVKDGGKLMKINNAWSEPQLANIEMNGRTVSCNKVSFNWLQQVLGSHSQNW